MKALLAKIEDIESSVKVVIGQISTLKEENEILRQENSRLLREINQLRKSSKGEESQEDSREHSKYNLSEHNINVELLRKELNACISEVQACLKEM